MNKVLYIILLLVLLIYIIKRFNFKLIEGATTEECKSISQQTCLEDDSNYFGTRFREFLRMGFRAGIGEETGTAPPKDQDTDDGKCECAGFVFGKSLGKDWKEEYDAIVNEGE